MSALSPFYPQLRTLVGDAGTAASCQERTHAVECAPDGGQFQAAHLAAWRLAYRCYGISGPAATYSALMFASRITLPHFPVSWARNFSNSAGGNGFGTLPRSASRARTFGSARPALISRL